MNTSSSTNLVETLRVLERQQQEIAGQLHLLRTALQAPPGTPAGATEPQSGLSAEVVMLKSELKWLREFCELLQTNFTEFREMHRHSDQMLWKSLQTQSPPGEPRPLETGQQAGTMAPPWERLEGEIAVLRSAFFEISLLMTQVKERLNLNDLTPATVAVNATVTTQTPVPRPQAPAPVSTVPVIPLAATAPAKGRRWAAVLLLAAIMFGVAGTTIWQWNRTPSSPPPEKTTPTPVVAATKPVAAVGDAPTPAPVALPAANSPLLDKLATVQSLVRAEDWQGAETLCRQLVAENPTARDPRFYLATTLASAGQIEAALREYREVLRLYPDYTSALNNLAYHLATHPDEKIRNGPEAVRLARRACLLTANRSPYSLDTLAAALAETGQLTEAAVTARRALKLAESGGFWELANDIQRRLEWYDEQLPYRDAGAVTSQRSKTPAGSAVIRPPDTAVVAGLSPAGQTLATSPMESHPDVGTKEQAVDAAGRGTGGVHE
jgi:tetratricopeptide (TPR) repeat protein